MIKVAIAGNPNAGKTTIFNRITGTRQKVGNWPGVTVEKKEAIIRHNSACGKEDICIIDLPGTYSLAPYSIEEKIARTYIVKEKPDVVIDVIDASNLERNLYLATQVVEIGIPLILALNMTDIARSKGMIIDEGILAAGMGAPVIFTVGTTGEGIHALLDKAVEVAKGKAPRSRHIHVPYGMEVENAISEIEKSIEGDQNFNDQYHARWIALKLLESDEDVKGIVTHEFSGAKDILEQTDTSRTHIKKIMGDDPEIIAAEFRYGFINGLLKKCLKIKTKGRIDLSQKIDLALTNKIIGIPIFIFFMWAMFELTFSLGAYPMGWINSGVTWLGHIISAFMTDGMLKSLIVDGIIGGVGSVAIFLPNIMILFFCIALFEDTGYMARAAFLMDKGMHTLGLHGKAFIPMIMGFGCNVPAIMATRVLESERDRRLTILINPFMSCSARLPIYILLAGTFFTQHAGMVVFSIYVLGIVMAVVIGQIFSKTILRGKSAPFVMELPPYRAPTAQGLIIHMWERSKQFLKKMGGIILIGSIVVWALSTFPKEAPVHETYLGKIGSIIEPVMEPLGLDWKSSVALLAGITAKEIVVSTMGVIYATENEHRLGAALHSSGMTPLKAYVFMVFALLYIPCIATFATMKTEMNSLRWALFGSTYSLVLAWGMSFIIYNCGKALGWG